MKALEHWESVRVSWFTAPLASDVSEPVDQGMMEGYDALGRVLGF